MDLSSTASIVIGAVLALGGALLTDRMRGRSELSREDRAVRRQCYLNFLGAVDGAYGRLRALANPDADRPSPEDVRPVLGVEGVFRSRQELLVTASPGVARAGEQAIKHLDRLADAVANGHDRNSPTYHDAFHDFCDSQWLLRLAIRRDLRVEKIPNADLAALGWTTSSHCEYCLSRRELPDGRSAQDEPSPSTT